MGQKSNKTEKRSRRAKIVSYPVPRQLDRNGKHASAAIGVANPNQKHHAYQEDGRGEDDVDGRQRPQDQTNNENDHGLPPLRPLMSSEIVNERNEALQRAHALLADFSSARSPLTLKAYQSDLSDFATALGEESPASAVALLISSGPGEANRLALRYRDLLQQAQRAPATIARRLATLRSLCRVARMVGIITWTLDLAGPRLSAYRDTRGPGRGGFQRLLQAAEMQDDPKKRARDLAILWLLYGRALRRSEVCRLAVPDDVDIAGSRIRIHGKHRAEPEWVTIPPASVRALTQWLLMRGVARGPLFTRLDRVAAEAKRMSGEHGPLTGEAVRQLVRDLGLRVNVQTRPHGLRHAAITEALAATHGDLRAVQRYARLKSANTIKIYDDERADLGGEVARMVAP